jgi:hypothetical protein
VHTPRFCGHAAKAGTVLFSSFDLRGFRTNWLTVAINLLLLLNQIVDSGKK